MALILEALTDITRKPTVAGVLYELMFFCAPIWVAVLTGLLVGWAWKPKWAVDLCDHRQQLISPNDGGSSSSSKASLQSCSSSEVKDLILEKEKSDVSVQKEVKSAKLVAITEDDLKHLCQLVEGRDGGPEWIPMMDRSLPTMSMTYQAWRRDHLKGPPQYRSRTIFEDATPETVRDFFWDDEFRTKSKWDDMLIHHETLEECTTTGTMLVHWTRKFPLFCSDRDYTIGRRIWSSDRSSYYCVTKGVPCLSVPRRKSPKRVDLFYSSWVIRPVESGRAVGEMTATEVLLFHHEDMGIPYEIAKLGIRRGMWGAVRKIEPGLRAYQMMVVANDNMLSRSAAMARISTKISEDCFGEMDGKAADPPVQEEEPEPQQPVGGNLAKFIVIGGAVLLACTLDKGLLTRAAVFGVGRRLGNIRNGRRN